MSRNVKKCSKIFFYLKKYLKIFFFYNLNILKHLKKKRTKEKWIALVQNVSFRFPNCPLLIEDKRPLFVVKNFECRFVFFQKGYKRDQELFLHGINERTWRYIELFFLEWKSKNERGRCKPSPISSPRMPLIPCS